MVRNPKWKASKNVDNLDKALDGQKLDEEAIVKVLCNCNSTQRSELKKLFKMQTKEDLLLVIRETLSGDFLELTLVMLREPLAFDIDLINVFLQVSKSMELDFVLGLHKRL